ncbi:Hypothetical protein glysoja_024209 [Glycine soja]|uniref:NAD-dependent epimerase/dehydratase domain-containing protein n=1 Tax=Glycine soja TaxID=3848 RepID=A0A0B2PAY2_GLYSO|nr:Hypothetical protein glysoja_024209 [Glycine soja]
MASFLSFLPAVSARPIPTSAFSPKRPLFQTPPTLHFKNHRFAVSCSYAEAGVNANSSSNTIDVVADVRSERIVVLGGNGFVGSSICKAAVSKGIEVISLSRSGRPTYSGAWVDQVTWISGMLICIVLRPAFIYGKRRVDGFELPLDLVGEPAEKILRAVENFTKPLSSLPASDLLLAPPVSVDDVALAVINGVTDDDFFGIFTIDQIKEAANKVRV